MGEAIVVLCTAKDAVEARRIARSLVEERVAACVNILPAAESVYRWQNAIEIAQESIMLIKTTRARYADLEAALKRLHSYEVPEILALGVFDGAQAYLEWIGDSVLDPLKSGG